MGLFKEIAMPMVNRSVPIIPLGIKSKVAFLTGWEKLASIDTAQIEQWDKDYPDANSACVAFADLNGVWFLEIDKPGFVETIEQETSKKIPDTFMVRSSPGRGHFYWKQTPASIAMGNTQGKDDNGKEAWSARVDKRYVVGPGSYHPTSGRQYEILRDTPIVEAPDWLVNWCVSKSKQEQINGNVQLDDVSPIAEGSRNTELTRILGRARQVMSMDREELYRYGLSVNQKRCKPPLSDSEIRTIANSIGGYAVTVAPPVIMGGIPLGQPQILSPDEVQVPKLNNANYPVFPSWVMHGTSLYENFVKPVCEQNSRIPYFMFLPAAALMLNYLGVKVKVERRRLIPSIFMVLIGEKGRAIKSSSVEDAIEYLHYAGVMEHAGDAIRNAEGKSIVWTVGSPEGLGMDMTRANCKNAVLFYDELSHLVSKAGIESSNLKSTLLSIYESAKFSNTIKHRRETYNIDPGTYCASLIACTTTENYDEHWSHLAGKSSGLDDRFIFVLQPEQLNDLTPQIYVNTLEGALETRKRIEKAIQQRVYQIDDIIPLEKEIVTLGNRTEIRAEKWALYFAVDLGRDSIDEECVGRGLALAKYELAVKKYLGAPEAETKIAAAQLKYRRLLERKFQGRAQVRDMERTMNSYRYGTEGWFRIYGGLVKAGIIAEIGTNPKEVIVREALD